MDSTGKVKANGVGPMMRGSHDERAVVDARAYATFTSLDINIGSDNVSGSSERSGDCDDYLKDYSREEEEPCSPYDLSHLEEEMLLAEDNEDAIDLVPDLITKKTEELTGPPLIEALDVDASTVESELPATENEADCEGSSSRTNGQLVDSINKFVASKNEAVCENNTSKANDQSEGDSRNDPAVPEREVATVGGEESSPSRRHCPGDRNVSLLPDSRCVSCSDRDAPTLTLSLSRCLSSCSSGTTYRFSVSQEDFDTTADHLSLYVHDFYFGEGMFAGKSNIDSSLGDGKSQTEGSNMVTFLNINDNSLAERLNIGTSLCEDKLQTEGHNMGTFLDEDDMLLAEGSNMGTSLDEDNTLLAEGSNMGTSIEKYDNLLADGSSVGFSLPENEKLLQEGSNMSASLDEDDTLLAVGSNMGTSHDEDQLLVEGSNMGTSLDKDDKLLADGSNMGASLDEDDMLLEEGSNMGASLDEGDMLLEEGSNMGASFHEGDKWLVEGFNMGASLDEDDILLEEGSNMGTSLDKGDMLLEEGSYMGTSIEEHALLAEGSNMDTSLDEDKLLAEGSNMGASLDKYDNMLAEGSNMCTFLDKDVKLLAEGSNMATSLDKDDKLLAEGSNMATSLDKDDKLLSEGSNMATSLDKDDKLLSEGSNMATSLDKDDKLLSEGTNVGTFLDKFDVTLSEGLSVDISLDDDVSTTDSVFTISSTVEDMLLADDDDVKVTILDRPIMSCQVVTLDSLDEALNPAKPVVMVNLDDSNVEFVSTVSNGGEIETLPRDVGTAGDAVASEGGGSSDVVRDTVACEKQPYRAYTPSTKSRSWPAFPDRLVALRQPPPIMADKTLPPVSGGGGWQEIFISSDPAENRDNFDPRWEEIRLLHTDEERYSMLKKGWKNVCSPDPNRNLTSRLVGDWSRNGRARYPNADLAQEVETKWQDIIQGSSKTADHTPYTPESSQRPRSRSFDSHHKPRRAEWSLRPRLVRSLSFEVLDSHEQVGPGKYLRDEGRSDIRLECDGLSSFRGKGEGGVSPASCSRDSTANANKGAGPDSGRGGGQKRRREEEDGSQLPPAKRPRNVACKQFYEDMLRDVVWRRNELLDVLDNAQQAELANLHDQQQLEMAHVVHRNWQPAITDLMLQQTQSLQDLRMRHYTARQQVAQEYESRISVLKAALAELTNFYDFYKGVTSEDTSLLTDVEAQELIEVEEALNSYATLYHDRQE